jgi:quinoprotein glucose dehydrogenase
MVLFMRPRLSLALTFALVCIAPSFIWSASVARGDDSASVQQAGGRAASYDPPIAKASDEGQKAIRSFRVPAGLKVELFAAEPLLANPVAFCIDERGVAYVAETFRYGEGVTDTREHMDWLDDDLACRTVADRVAMYKKYLDTKFASFHVQHERVKRVVDRDGDGRADESTVFADGFNDPASGIGAGVLARKGEVYYTCIPGLWKLRDSRGDGHATERTLLHDGYGVHVGFIGHDLHGLKFGPDGRLYFTMGDRGFNVTTFDGKTLAVPDTGSVLRCNPDGTELEVFATGLRNPQELAFDQFGNLFTGENNSDSGDRARWVYLVEGGDSGWRIGYQFLEAPYSRGPWNEEQLWYPSFAGQAAYIVPPIANLADGPSGLVYDPGVSLLPAEYKNHFFLVDFRGSSSSSGIRSFALEPQGASFKLVDSKQFLWSVLATDVDFGSDGALYFCDWVEGWDKPKKGRIYRLLDESRRNDPAIREVKKILAKGMENHGIAELARLLAHADMRVRQEAQFELAARGGAAWQVLAAVAGSNGETLPRIHAVWGLGQIARVARGQERPRLWPVLGPLLTVGDAEVRANAAKVLGEARETEAFSSLVRLLEDKSRRVRFFAAISLGKLGRPEAAEPLLAMLRTNNDGDPYLRHAGVMGLVGSGKTATWMKGTRDQSPAARVGVLLALRRERDPEIARFLDDPDPRLVLEAARAIHDVPIEGALPRLAALPVTASSPLPLLRRVWNAAFRLGGPEHAAALAAAAVKEDLPAVARTIPLELLARWANPPGRDGVVGLWRPIAARPAHPAAEALAQKLATILRSSTGRAQTAAIRAAANLQVKDAGESLAALAGDANRPDSVRALALEALGQLNDSRVASAASRALAMPGSRSRTEALRLLARTDPAKAVARLEDRLRNGSTLERQGAVAILGSMAGEPARKLLSDWLDRLIAGKAPAEIQLDLLEAGARRSEPEFHDKIKKYESAKPRDDPLSAYREVLAGGARDRGRAIFSSRADVECIRCHKIRGPFAGATGGEVGPELSGVGARLSRTELLESVVSPDKKIAQGFESVVLATSDGKVHTGIVRGEDAREVQLITAEGNSVIVPKDSIEERKRGQSAMPADVAGKLSKTELRDLIEFLASLKASPRSSQPAGK